MNGKTHLAQIKSMLNKSSKLLDIVDIIIPPITKPSKAGKDLQVQIIKSPQERTKMNTLGLIKIQKLINIYTGYP